MIINRGEVWFHNPKTSQGGHRQGGPRPVIIVSNNLCNKYSSVVSGVPCTSRAKKNMPTHVLFTIDGVYNTALVEQVGPILTEDLVSLKYTLNKYLVKQIDDALEIALGLKPSPDEVADYSDRIPVLSGPDKITLQIPEPKIVLGPVDNVVDNVDKQTKKYRRWSKEEKELYCLEYMEHGYMFAMEKYQIGEGTAKSNFSRFCKELNHVAIIQD